MATRAERPTHYSVYGTIEKASQFHTMNTQLLEEYLAYCYSKGLSPESLKQYKNKVEIFFVWLLEKRGNKSYIEVTAQDIMMWQSEAMKASKSSSTIRQIRAAVSGLSKYIATMYDSDYPSFRNVWEKVPAPKQEYIRAKTYLPASDFTMLKQALIERKEWQKLTYLSLSYDSAGRKTEIWLASKFINWDKRETNIVRGKGGKTFTLPFSKETEEYIKKWLEARGDDTCDKLFVFKTMDGKARPLSKQTLNNFCEYFSALYEELTGKEVTIYPHCFRSNRISNLYNDQHIPLEIVQQLGHHSDASTTLKSYIEHREDAMRQSIFGDDDKDERA